jgi:hypothetical protein
MIINSLLIDPSEFGARTDWEIKPEGACKGSDVCVPLRQDPWQDGQLDARVLSKQLGMPLVHDEKHNIWALGPESAVSGRVLSAAEAPDLEFPDVDGNMIRLSSLRGQKVVMVAWASY